MYIKVYSLCCKVLWVLTNTSYLIFTVTVSYRIISPSGLVNFSLLDFIPEILLALSLECIYNLRIYHLHCCLLLPSRFTRVRFCATPETAAHQAPPSLGFSRQEYWSGVPLPSPKMGVLSVIRLFWVLNIYLFLLIDDWFTIMVWFLSYINMN